MSGALNKSIWSSLLNIYLYCNFHIALGALSLCFFTEMMLGIAIERAYYAFVFASTLFLYSLHRVVGLRKISSSEHRGRFLIIKQLGPLLHVIIILSLVATLYFYIYLPSSIKIYLIFPGVISLGYAIPIWADKRLRDLPYIKIFLIAISWSLITVTIPAIDHRAVDLELGLLTTIIALFFISITIPFDIRDMRVDQLSDVPTLPSLLGIKGSVFISILSLCIGCILFWVLYSIGSVPLTLALFMIGFYLLLSLIIYNCRTLQDDLYYTGFLDGTMILHGFVFLFLN